MDEALVERFARWTDAPALGESLVRRYAEPQRRYHTAEHLSEVLWAIDRSGGEDPFAVELAAWYHDAIYDPTAPHGQNEAASAALARRELGALGVVGRVIDEVARLVLLTAGHEVPPGDVNGVALADADLEILGAPPPRYWRYVRDVRAEHSHVAEADWRIGRAAVLRGFLDRPRIYLAAPAHERLDRRARTNLADELRSLEA
jgi:predicted metal-dependent HD superfamily phosphohydrolase